MYKDPNAVKIVSERCRRAALYIFAGALVVALAGCNGAGTAQTEDELRAQVEPKLAKSEYAAAGLLLKDFLRANPQSYYARYTLAKSALASGFPTAAADEFGRAAAIDPSAQEAQIGLARALIEHRDFDRAENVVNDLKDSASVIASALRAEVLTGQQKFADAHDLLAKLLREHTDSVDAHLAALNYALATGEARGGRGHEQWLEEHAADNLRAWLFIGEARLMRGDAGPATDAFAKAAALSPNHPIALFGWGKAAISAGRMDEAEKPMARLRKQAKDSPMLAFLDGYLAFSKGEFEVAKEKLRLVLKANGTQTQAQGLLAQILLSEGQYEQAASYLEILNNRLPGNVRIARALTYARLQSNQSEKAIAAAAPLIGDDPKKAAGEDLALLGRAYIETGDLARGREMIAEASGKLPDSGELKLELGAVDLALGHLSDAVVNLERGVASEEEPGEAQMALIAAYVRAGDLNKAEGVAQRLVERFPKEPISYNLAGGVQALRNHPDRARELYEKALALDADYEPAALNLADMDRRAGNLAPARARYEAVLKGRPANVNALVGLSQVARAENKLDEARALLDKAYGLAPRDRSVVFAYAEQLVDQRESRRALPLLVALGKDTPNDRAVAKLLARAYYDLGEGKLASRILNNLVEAGDNDAGTQMALALANAQGGDVKQTREAATKALANKDTEEAARNLLASSAIAAGEFAEAQGHIAALEKLKPESVDVLALKGDLAYARRQGDEAAALYTKVLEQAPSETYAVKRYAALRRAGHLDQALAQTEAWIKANPSQVQPMLAVADGYVVSGKDNLAIPHLERALELDPKNIVALNNLALAKSRQGQDGTALAARAYELAPDNVNVIDTYGWVQIQNGAVEAGIDLLNKALVAEEKRNPNGVMPDLRYHLAAGLLKSGARDRAVRELRKALASKDEFQSRPAAEQLLKSLQ